MPKRYAFRKDANHGTIKAAFEALGAGVYDAANDNAPYDLVVFWRGRTMFVEVKDPDKPPSKRKLTEDAVRFHDTARRHGVKVEIVERETQAYALLGGRVSA